MSEQDLSAFYAAIEARRAKKAAREGTAVPPPVVAPIAPDLVPEIDSSRSEEDNQIDAVLAGVGVLDAYERWINKMHPDRSARRTEGIKISCPLPGHADVHPSAWANTENDTWFCGGCQEGGDKFDLAAIAHGYARPDYKTGRAFADLRRDMVRDLGYSISVSSDPAIGETVYRPEIPPPPAPEADNVTPIRAIQEIVTPDELDALSEALGPNDELEIPTFDWHSIVTVDSFLETYMDCVTVDDTPEEYHFWAAMAAIGLAVGRDVALADSLPVFGNLNFCIVGRTAARKSRSLKPLERLLLAELPREPHEIFSRGVKLVSEAASGEALIWDMQSQGPDPAAPKTMKSFGWVRGYMTYGELADLSSRAGRMGSTIKSKIMGFADCAGPVSNSSRTSGEVTSANHFLTVATTTQPDSLRDLLSDADLTSGFLNRWIFVTGQPKEKEAIGRIKIDIEPARAPLRAIHDWASSVAPVGSSEPFEMGYTPGAEKAWTDHFHTQIVPLQDQRPILGRLDLIEKKLMLLLALNDRLEVVTEEVVARVVILHAYLVAAFGVTERSMIKQTINNEIYEDIMRHVQHLTEKDPYGPTRRQLWDRMRYKQNYDIKAFDQILNIIADKDDRIEVNQGNPDNKRGRKSDHYRWVAV